MMGLAIAAPPRHRRHRKPPELAADFYDVEAEHERVTAAALGHLPPGPWTVLHDVQWPGRKHASIDHIVLGPSGIFVIASKLWPGEVSVDRGTLRQGTRTRHRDVMAAEDAAWAVAQLTPSVPSRLVHPVICVVRDEPLSGSVGDVLVCSTVNIAELIGSRPHEMSSEQLRVAPGQLRAHLQERVVPTGPPPSSRVAAAAPRKASRKAPPVRKGREPAWRKGRKHSGLVAPFLLTVAAAAVFVAAPDAVIDGAQMFGRLVEGYVAR